MSAKSREVATQAPQELAGVSQEELDALLNQQDSEFDTELFTTPILKIGQPLTREVQAEQADAGEFIDTLAGEGLGTSIDFIIAYYQRGRFAADRDSGRAYVAFGDLIPDGWADLTGEEFVGTPFDEYPEAEEVFKARVNAKEIPWGRGPKVATTHNFTGLALVSPVDGSDDEPEIRPVRLSLQRTNMPAVRKILTLRKASTAFRNKPFWDKVFTLSTEKKTFDKGMAYILSTPKIGRDSTPDERQMAVELALAVRAGRVGDNQASDAAADKPSEPDAKGGLEV